MDDLFKQLEPGIPARRQKSYKNFVAEAIAIERVEIGLTQQELAEKANIGLGQLRKLEQGHLNVTLNTLLKVLKALKLSISINPE